MASITRKKKFKDQTVYEAALDRVRRIYDTHDSVVVSFSGGKDSTVVLELASIVCRERGLGPVQVIFFDEECMCPPTAEYLARVAKRDDVNVIWYCLPIMHRNACSNEEPFWYCWDPKKKPVWVREPPENGIFDHPRWIDGLEYQDWCPLHFAPEDGNACILTGIRAQESFRRLKMVTARKRDNWIMDKTSNIILKEPAQIEQFIEKAKAGHFDNFSYIITNSKVSLRTNTLMAHPIYDWDQNDVWKIVEKHNLDYNRTYDGYDKTDLHGKYLTQRVGIPFGEEPLRGLYVYKEVWPEMFNKFLKRVAGVNTAFRYANTELYSRRLKSPPDGLTWKEYLPLIVSNYGPLSKKVGGSVNKLIKDHYRMSTLEIEEERPDPVSGCCWKYLCKVALRGDFKSRTGQVMNNQAVGTRGKLGVNLVEALEKYATPGHREKHLENFIKIGQERGEPIP